MLSTTLSIVLSLAIASPATAQTSATVSAETLFDQGRKLMAEGKYAEACPKFADSQRLDPSPSTLLNLGLCYEKNGQTASAWVTYRAAASSAQAAGRADYVATATKRADALQPKLSKLTIAVTAPVEGLVIKRDGVSITQSEWGAAIPVDPGKHAVDASAPHYKPWHDDVEVGADAASASLSIPKLEEAPPELTSKPSQPSETAAPKTSALPIVGLVVAGVGVIGLGVAGVFVARGKSKFDASLAHCVTTTSCDDQGVSLRNDARSAGNAATIAFTIGSVALVSGLALFVFSPRSRDDDRAAPQASVRFSPTLGGGVLLGEF